MVPGGAPHLLAMAVLAAVAGGLAAVERKGALQLMLSRPIVLAPVMGWLLGDAEGGLLLGVPLELLFLGGVNLGGSLPDNESLLAAALTALVVPAGLAARTGVDPPLAALGLALVFPLALVGRRMERASELRNLQLLAVAQKRSEAGDIEAARVNLRGLLLPFGASAGISALAVLAPPVLSSAPATSRTATPAPFGGARHALWAGAAGGGGKGGRSRERGRGSACRPSRARWVRPSRRWAMDFSGWRSGPPLRWPPPPPRRTWGWPASRSFSRSTTRCTSRRGSGCSRWGIRGARAWWRRSGRRISPAGRRCSRRPARCWPARWRRGRCSRPDCRGGRFMRCWSLRPWWRRSRFCRGSAWRDRSISLYCS